MQSEKLEIQAVGHLENALSWIFRLNEQNVLHHVSLAKQVCKRIPCNNNNRIFLKGRCEYLLGLLYLYLDDDDKAEIHVWRAKATLCYTEVGEDKTFACYVDAKLAAKLLPSTRTLQQLQQVIELFTLAIEYKVF